MSESPLIQFYRGDGTDHAGRHLDEILAWPDTHLEAVHDYVQWLFPLAAPSRFNPDAPCLTPDDIGHFRVGGLCRKNFQRSFKRMLAFYGLEYDDTDSEDVYVDPTLLFEVRSRVWLTPNNHNYLRITRILNSAQLLGFRPYALGLFDFLHRHYREAGGRVGNEPYAYWRKAVGR